MWCYLEKINSIVPGCVSASGKKGFSPDMKTTATWCQINEKVSFCSFKQWAGPAQRHVYSCICCLKIKTQPEFKKKKKKPKRDAKELRPVFIHSGALWLLGRWTQVDNHTVFTAVDQQTILEIPSLSLLLLTVFSPFTINFLSLS